MAGVKGVVATVREGISPVADELGYMLWDVEYLKEGSRRILRVTIDNEAGITIEDCERMHTLSMLRTQHLAGLVIYRF